MHVNTSIEICTQHISLHQCRASEFHIDYAMNKWQISCPLSTSPMCLQTQSPHPYTNIHICTLQIKNVLYTHTPHQHTYLSFIQNFPTLLSSLIYIHLQKHNKCTFTSCRWGTFLCSSWPHISHTFTLHSLAPVPHCPIPHTLYKSIQSMPHVSLLPVMHIHTHLCQWTHTHPCLPTGTLLAGWLQWREALWCYSKQDLKTMVLNSHLLETRCVKHSHPTEAFLLLGAPRNTEDSIR